MDKNEIISLRKVTIRVEVPSALRESGVSVNFYTIEGNRFTVTPLGIISHYPAQRIRTFYPWHMVDSIEYHQEDVEFAERLLVNQVPHSR